MELMFCFRFQVFLPDGHFFKSNSRPLDWTHFVLNYLGPNEGQGIRIFYNGAEVGTDTDKHHSSWRWQDCCGKTTHKQ